ncbi:hypothetical protein [Brevundimonas lutea]|uniref:hypothetical protein n=1 Tax=Brevundimonas lutea TaxID=2293980 RepID=UPI000F0161D9|nr:hypothetical protein [Brevundimonas lutea]
MVDQVADGVTASHAEACGACGVARAGRYCHACGQDGEATPRPLREWAEEAFSETNLVDGRTAKTLVALIIKPGRYLEACRDAAGSIYQSPTKLFVVMTALFLLTLNFAGVSMYQFVAQPIDPAAPITARADPNGYTVHLTNVAQAEVWMQRTVEPGVDPRVTAAIEAEAARASTEYDRQNLLYENQNNRELAIVAERLTAWLPNVVWLLLPAYALLLAPFFGRRRMLMEHLIFALWGHVTAFALLILLALANKWGAALPGWVFIPPYLAYVTVAAARYYGLSRGQALWRGTVHLAAYVLLAVMPVAIVIALSAMDREAFVTFISA